MDTVREGKEIYDLMVRDLVAPLAVGAEPVKGGSKLALVEADEPAIIHRRECRCRCSTELAGFRGELWPAEALAGRGTVAGGWLAVLCEDAPLKVRVVGCVKPSL